MTISPRLMNSVMIPYKWKRFIYHEGRARDQHSIAEIGLVAGGNVNGIHPAPDIHEHFMIHKGYGTLRISSRTISTILRPL